MVHGFVSLPFMNPSFGDIFGVPLVNDRVSSLKYVPPADQTMKALLISDCHLGATCGQDPIRFNQSLQVFMDSVNALIEKEQPTVLFILGDLVDGTQNDTNLKKILERLNSVSVPVYAFGGNHDREFFANLATWTSPPNVTITQALSIQISVELKGGKIINVFLAHDLLNNYRVRDPHAFFFVSWIKNGCRNYIKPDDWLITGHTHTGFISHAHRLGCIGQFSPEIRTFGYATLELDNDVVFSVKNSLKSSR